MIIEPKVRGFICTAAHPVGCAHAVKQQIDFVKQQGPVDGPKNVLIIGASTGYGLATRIATTFASNAKTIGVFFERPAMGKRTASAGWYNTAAFEEIVHEEGHYAKSINGDAFSDEIKQQTIDLIREDLGKIDLVVYSLASPRRTDPRDGKTYSSTLKPIGETFTNKTVDPIRGDVKQVSIEPANEDDIANTVKVMGGEDWQMWMDLLRQENLLTDDAITVAYTYIGPELTHAVYKNGTIGRAKDDLQATADTLNEQMKATGGRAFLSVNKALVTQASAAIPVVPLYISILFKLMKDNGTHEGCIEQMDRMLREHIYASNNVATDDKGRARLDDLEMADDIQAKIEELWTQVDSDNIETLTDINGYREDFYRLFGFNFDGIDYAADVDPNVKIASIADTQTV